MFSRAFLAFNAISIGLIGACYLADPDLLLALYDLEAGSPGMDNMLRATYGGMYLGSAALFLLGALFPRRRRDSLGFVAIFMGGAAVGRIASLVAVGSPPALINMLLAFECVAALIAVFLYSRASLDAHG